MADIWENMVDIWENMTEIWEFHDFCTFGHMGKYGGHMGKYVGHVRDLMLCHWIWSYLLYYLPDRKNEINLIPKRYHWDQLDAKVIVLDINFPVR
jgi:hypothetical protein